MAKLTDPITILRGIGPAKAKLFHALNIFTLEDLICHFPRGYEDRTKLVNVCDLEVDKPACFRAMVMNTPRTNHIRQGLDMTKVQVADATGRLHLTFFNSRFASDNLEYGREYIFYGTLTGDFMGCGMTNPVFESPDSTPVTTRRVLPIYPLTAGLSNQAMLRAVTQALAICDPPAEVLPAAVRQQYGILGAQESYHIIHQPQTMDEAMQARKRMIFEEFFVFSAGLSLMRAARAGKQAIPYRNTDIAPFLAQLPFTLTGAQTRAIGEIIADFQKGTPMNRLVQGDVGSGKTMVAAAAAFCAAQNGFQTALMAPTEILAEQHYASLSRLFAPLGIGVALLTGSMTQKEKKAVREGLLDGIAQIAVGTHALISDSTVFQRLGMVIADEQHRFGVAQRAALCAKGTQPHLLLLSATPIPRTLALIVYGDLDVSVVDELPPGREPVETFLVDERYRARLNAFVRKQAAEGHQSFIVCPAVEDDGGDGGETLKAAEQWAQTLQNYVFPNLRVALLHGKMKGAEKEAVMASFAAGEADILVATTVIEVGVDVPNATLMVIENADRFGLSQLHQLRGRVGRGSAKAWCVLVSDSKNPETRQRLRTLCGTNDGFRIAEADLQQRGPGDFFGSRQHGLPVFRVGDLATDLAVLRQAQEAAAQLISQDRPLPSPLAQAIESLLAGSADTLN